ncbi:CrcB family protein [Sporosarcina sp. PTS2304]|uniref:fluoride efflux transporter FluC n=1 Tax=Sporosarcina sp. PTS2304 TaxID=2283194 RepID=UPI000E0D0AEB|nr:CrcB family protein [Sporosarcina sp. PTS2304]AXH99636.1 CrcB family protein [Sporosarcina sp. PTS2304]
MIWHYVAVGCGGILGALLRYECAARLNKSSMPYGTLLVNSIGCFFIGWIIGLGLPTAWLIFWATGVAGALTTYSTLMKEIWTYWIEDQKTRAILYTVLTFGLGLVLAYTGYSL